DQDENKFVDTEMEFDAELTPSNSVWFNDQVSSFLPQFEIDMPIVLEREDVIKIIKEKFIASGIDRPNLRSSVEDLFIGIAIAESRLDESAVSSQGAFRWLQLMPTTWDDLAKEGESKDSLEDNIAVAVRLLEQEYRYLTQTCFVELAHIQKEF
ncbi:lytic transglycosylase domain-containing protein, partial [Candidatus Kaiserbacteria bacterium]|nr:lytic transglycosylase domain-containing protein [Candidatus Kaiserbacteria bacterium]